MRLLHIFYTALATTTTFLVVCSTFLLVQANNAGFTVDLIHRDSPKSPFYNPLSTPSQRVKSAFQRSLNRANQFASTTNVIPNGGEYLMKISYGTPPFETLAIADTGSDLTWTMCLPCNTGDKEKSSIFNPKNSSTFQLVPCTSKTCHEFSNAFCTLTDDSTTCEYEVEYEDLSSTSGDVAMETITMEGSVGEKLSLPNFIFGCGHEQEGDFTEKGHGIVGLGFEKQSLNSQLNSTFHGKFSYCFGPPNEVSKPGKIRFGDNRLSSQEGVVSTPLFLNSSYYLKLEGISVANTRLENHESISSSGNFLIDSGTTYTFLPTKLYYDYESTIILEIGSQNIVDDPNNIFNLCYSSLVDRDIPNVTVHFTGADLKLSTENIFQRTSPSSVCLGFLPGDSFAVFGNLAQANFWVEYDLENKIVSFQPADCTSQ